MGSNVLCSQNEFNANKIDDQDEVQRILKAIEQENLPDNLLNPQKDYPEKYSKVDTSNIQNIEENKCQITIIKPRQRKVTIM